RGRCGPTSSEPRSRGMEARLSLFVVHGVAAGARRGSSLGETHLARLVTDADAAVRRIVAVADDLPLRGAEHIVLRAALPRAPAGCGRRGAPGPTCATRWAGRWSRPARSWSTVDVEPEPRAPAS